MFFATLAEGTLRSREDADGRGVYARKLAETPAPSFPAPARASGSAMQGVSSWI